LYSAIASSKRLHTRIQDFQGLVSFPYIFPMKRVMDYPYRGHVAASGNLYEVAGEAGAVFMSSLPT